MIKRIFSASIAATLALGLLPAASTLTTLNLTPAGLAASCTKEEAYDRVTPQTAADGTFATWVLRKLSAVDWASSGFASQVMWTSTNYQTVYDEWVEVGATQGWEGSNVYTFYTAHGDYTVTPNVYNEARWTSPLPVVGNSQGFTIISTSTSGVGTYTAYVGSSGISWNHHLPNSSNYLIGLESTCDTSEVDRTYVSSNMYRERSSKNYFSPNSGSLLEAPPGPQGIDWCSSPVRFRYYLNSAISTTLCS